MVLIEFLNSLSGVLPRHPAGGKQVQDVAEALYREIIDVEVEVAFQRRAREETQS